MGQTSSKEAGSKVFLPEAPTTFSGKLRETLQTNPETDYALNQYSSKYIEDRVAERLYKARVEADAELRAAENKIAQIDEERLANADTPALQQRLADLSKTLAGRPRKGHLDKKAEIARGALVRCIETNNERILNCRTELAAFQDEVRRAEQATGL